MNSINPKENRMHTLKRRRRKKPIKHSQSVIHDDQPTPSLHTLGIPENFITAKNNPVSMYIVCENAIQREGKGGITSRSLRSSSVAEGVFRRLFPVSLSCSSSSCSEEDIVRAKRPFLSLLFLRNSKTLKRKPNAELHCKLLDPFYNSPNIKK